MVCQEKGDYSGTRHFFNVLIFDLNILVKIAKLEAGNRTPKCYFKKNSQLCLQNAQTFNFLNCAQIIPFMAPKYEDSLFFGAKTPFFTPNRAMNYGKMNKTRF